MVNKYLLAFLLTSILVIAGFAFTRWTDDQRVANFRDIIDESVIEQQSTEQLLLYESIFEDKSSVCPALFSRIESQMARTRNVLKELESAQKQSVFSNFDLVKRKYHAQNIELYLLIEKAIKDCGYNGIEPVVFFYSDKTYCPDCLAQGKVLDSIAVTCPNVRIFAFPWDLGIPVVDVIKAKNNVNKVPSIVFNAKTTEGLVSSQYLLSGGFFECKEANKAV